MLDMGVLIQEDFHVPSGKVEISVPSDSERKKGEGGVPAPSPIRVQALLHRYGLFQLLTSLLYVRSSV